MAYQVPSGEIQPGVLYIVSGTQSVIYNAITYISGQNFSGITGIRTFTYSGNGTQQVNEVLELTGSAIELSQDNTTQPIYAEETRLNGFAIEYELNGAEKIVQETTKIQGFAMEFIDFPFYSFEIVETRL